MRSSAQSSQLFSNAKIPVIRPNTNEVNRYRTKQHDSKKRAKSKKVFMLQFNDMEMQKRMLGQGMQVQGMQVQGGQVQGSPFLGQKNHDLGKVVPMHVQTIQRAMHLRREQHTKTADIIRHHAPSTIGDTINYEYISNASQVQM